MSSILIRTAVIVLLLAVLGFGAGLAFGAIWGWSVFSLGLIGLLVHHVRHLRLLRRWASRSLTEAVPEGRGAWEEVFTLLYRRQRAETARSRQLAYSLARSRQAGRALPYGVAILDAEYRIGCCFRATLPKARVWRPCDGTSSRTFRTNCAPRSPCWWGS